MDINSCITASLLERFPCARVLHIPKTSSITIEFNYRNPLKHTYYLIEIRLGCVYLYDMKITKLLKYGEIHWQSNRFPIGMWEYD